MEGAIVLKKAQLARALRIIPYLIRQQVNLLASEARKRRKGERDRHGNIFTPAVELENSKGS